MDYPVRSAFDFYPTSSPNAKFATEPPRVWVKTAQWDPNLPIRGRYLALRLAPEKDAQWYAETSGQMVLFFVPERTLPFESQRGRRDAPELWAEVTIPHKGPPRPIRLAVKKDGRMELLDIK